MHHLVFGINFQIHSVSLTILVSIYLLIHLSTQHIIIPTFVIPHSFTLSLQAQNLPILQILPTVYRFLLLNCLTIMGLDRTYHAHHFVFSFTFYFFVYSVW